MKITSSIFKNTIRAFDIFDDETELTVSQASLDDLKKFIPDSDPRNIDVLPVAFNAFVANLVNKNGDVVDSETAVSLSETMLLKPINIEHNRKKVIGVITNAAFTEFGSDKELSKDEVLGMDEPFNVTLGGYIWKVVDEDVAEVIAAVSDEDSDMYEKVSASWEVGFTEMELVLIEGDSKNLKDGQIISEKSEVNKIKKNLTHYGGAGKYDGKNIYSKPKYEKTIALGIGLTENPAAAVKGIASNQETPSEESDAKETSAVETNDNKFKKLNIKISQTEKSNVKKIRTIMNINKLEDITDEALKEVSASTVHDFVKSQIKEANKQYIQEKEAKEKAEKDSKDLVSKVETLEDKLAKFEKAENERENQEKFNERMAYFDNKYELSSDIKKALASQLKTISDEDYIGYKSNTEVFLAAYDKEVIAKNKAEDTHEEESEEVVVEAIASAQKETSPINTAPLENNLRDKYAKAFSKEDGGVKIVANKKKR